MQKLIEPAAVALATALAMGLVELAMELGFKGIGKGLKKAGQAVKNGAKATVKGVKAAAHAGASGIKSLLKSGAKLVSKSGSMIIRNGKIVIKSLQEGFMKGVKKLKGLIGRILAKFKFKRFKLERKGKHIRLYGEVNPWVLLADGTIEEVESLDGRKAGISTKAEVELGKLGSEGTKKPRMGDADYEGELPKKSWRLSSNGDGAHMLERANVKNRNNLSHFDQANTPRYYPDGSPENAGQAHIRLHAATKRAGIKLRGGNPSLSDDELIGLYKQAYKDPELNGIFGSLRTPDGSLEIGKGLTPGEAIEEMINWGNLKK